jgi:hypothetical protein
MTRSRFKIGALAALGTLAGCSGGGGGDGDLGGTGTLSLAIMDAPVHDATEVWVTFTGVSLKPQGSGPAIDIDFPAPVKVDLLSLTADNAESLLSGHTVPAGHYNWLELHVDAVHDDRTEDSWAVLQSGGIEEIEVPSGSVRLVSGLTVTANQETSFLIDWNLHKGLNDPVGQSGLFLRPALRIIDMTQYGTLAGTVDMALVTAADCANDLNLDLGNSVYIYAGAGVTPDDFDTDAAASEPVATTAVTQDQTGAYVYETLLSPGDYTVAFTCQAMNDLPDTSESIVFLQPTNASISDGVTTTVDF